MAGWVSRFRGTEMKASPRFSLGVNTFSPASYPAGAKVRPKQNQSRTARLARAVVLTLGLAIFPLWGALAHADYSRSQPGLDAIVANPPDRVDIWFTQELFRRAGENRIEVFGPDGQPVHEGAAEIDDDDRAHLSVVLQPALTPGAYRVTWRTLSAEDGDTEEGEFSFQIDPQAAATSTPMGEGPTAGPVNSVTPTASQATVPPPPPPEAPPLASREAPPATPTEGLPAGGGCGLGLLPLVGLLGIACLPRRARR